MYVIIIIIIYFFIIIIIIIYNTRPSVQLSFYQSKHILARNRDFLHRVSPPKKKNGTAYFR